MKLSLLAKRENFNQVFQKSVSHFVRSFDGTNVSFAPKGSGGLPFRKNEKLNIIWCASLPAVRLSPLTAEYRYAAGRLRRWLQIAYCALAVRPPLFWLWSPIAFELVDAPVDVSEWVFLPGNHTIRVIDTARDRSFVFGKAGFSKHFFLRDAEVRMANPDLPVPAVNEFHAEDGWYCEQRIAGLPLNRISDSSVVSGALAKALEAVDRLRKRTAHKVSFAGYVSECGTTARHAREKLFPAVDIISTAIERFIELSENAALERAPAELILCESHGDFQPANIIVSRDRTWLIDWEYSAVRSVAYDRLVFATQSRFPAGLGVRLIAILREAQLEGGLVLWGERLAGAPRAWLALFLLEDIILKLSEVEASEIVDKAASIGPWVSEAIAFLEAPLDFSAADRQTR